MIEQYDGVSHSLASLRRSPGQRRIKDGRVAGSAARGDKCGRSSVVELLLPKQVVEGSNPFARSSLEPASRADLEAGYFSSQPPKNPFVHDSVHDILWMLDSLC